MDESVEGKKNASLPPEHELKGNPDMNTNPYPGGRWTSRNRPNRRAVKIESESLTALRDAPLRELFWAADESGLVLDARARIDALLSNAMAAAALAPIETVGVAVTAGAVEELEAA